MTQKEAFEKWYSDGGQAPRSIEKNDRGNYILSNTYLAWCSWQAAQAHDPVRKNMADALWVCAEHNALRFGENHNTVLMARAALAAAKETT